MLSLLIGSYSISVLSKSKADEWKNPKGAYIHAMHLHNWGGYSYEVTGKDENGDPETMEPEEEVYDFDGDADDLAEDFDE